MNKVVILVQRIHRAIVLLVVCYIQQLADMSAAGRIIRALILGAPGSGKGDKLSFFQGSLKSRRGDEVKNQLSGHPKLTVDKIYVKPLQNW